MSPTLKLFNLLYTADRLEYANANSILLFGAN